MKQEDVVESWAQAEGRVQAKWGKLTRAERAVLAERWQKRSEKLHETRETGNGKPTRALASLHRKQESFYPTLQDGNGSPEDDRDVSGFQDWGSA